MWIHTREKLTHDEMYCVKNGHKFSQISKDEVKCCICGYRKMKEQ